MSFAFVRPVDDALLSGRPLLDLGSGDGMTLGALAPDGFTVATDRAGETLRYNKSRSRVRCTASALPFAADSFEVVLAADLIHHLSDDELARVASEVNRVITASGRWVAWWYPEPLNHAPNAPDAPRHTRALTDAQRLVSAAGLRVSPLELTEPAFASTPTVGFVATR